MAKTDYKLWRISDFSRGQIEKLNDNVIPDNAAYEMRNFIPDRVGGLSLRKGKTLIGTLPASIQGLHPYYARSTGVKKLIAASAGEIYIYDDDFVKLSLSAVGVVDTSGTGVTWDSGDKFNTLWTGYIRINGVDYEIATVNSDTSITLSLTAGTQTGVGYAYASGNASVIGHPLYPLFGTALWGEPLFNEPDGTATLFPLDINEPTLFEDCVNYTVAMNGIDKPWKYDGTLFTLLTGAPVKGRYPILHKEKLFCVDADTPSTLEWSDSFAPETWTPTNYWDIRKGDGDEITNLTKFVGDLIIFKQRSIHILKGTSIDDFVLNEVSTSVGCAGPRASVVHNLKLYFVGEQGIYITNGMNVVNISEGFIPDLWARVNQSALYKAALTAWDNKIWIALPLDDSMINDLVLMYDPETQAYYPMDGIYPSCFTIFDSGTGAKLYSGSHNNGKVGIENTGYSDYGTAITAYWRGKYFDMGIPEVQKKARKIFVQDSNGKATVTVAVSVDYGAYNNLEYYRTEGLSREYNFEVDANRWRYVSPMISCTASAATEIKGIAIPYRPKGRLAVRE